MTNELNAAIAQQLAVDRQTIRDAGQSLSREQLDLLKRTVADGLTDDEFQLYCHICKSRGADPFGRMIYPVKRWNKKLNRETIAFQSSIDYFRSASNIKGTYAGMIGPQWCGPDGTWRDVWLDAKPPAAARVGILRHDCKEPHWGTALWSAYAQTDREGKLTQFWSKMGPLMLGKCAEALARRAAFPEQLGGLYTGDEMEQAENPPLITSTGGPGTAASVSGPGGPETLSTPTAPASSADVAGATRRRRKGGISLVEVNAVEVNADISGIPGPATVTAPADNGPPPDLGHIPMDPPPYTPVPSNLVKAFGEGVLNKGQPSNDWYARPCEVDACDPNKTYKQCATLFTVPMQECVQRAYAKGRPSWEANDDKGWTVVELRARAALKSYNPGNCPKAPWEE